MFAEKYIMLFEAKRDYYSSRIANIAGEQRSLFRENAKLLNHKTLQNLPSHSSLGHLKNKFADIFENKIFKLCDSFSKVNQELGGLSCSSTTKCSSSFSYSTPVSHDDVRIIMSSASMSCPLDPMPTTILKDYLDVMLQVITKIMNQYLSTSVMPVKLKQALLAHIITKAIIDTELLMNCRPISNLAFTSKIVERVVDSQLKSYITDNNLYGSLQSASTETQY